MTLPEPLLEVANRIIGYMELEDAPCFCGHRKGWDYEHPDRHGFAMKLRACERCGLVRTNPRPTAESLERYYREDFRDMYNPDGVEKLYKGQVGHGAGILQTIRHLDFKVVYDIGCGAGGIMKVFLDRGCEVSGCDFDQEYIEYGRAQMPGARLHIGDASNLEDGRADLVIANHTIEHRADLRDAIEEHKRKLAPGGHLYIGIPTIATIRSHYHTLTRYLCMPHMWHFTDESLAYVLRDCGLDPVVAWDGSALVRLGEGTARPDPHEMARVIGEMNMYRFTYEEIRRWKSQS